MAMRSASVRLKIRSLSIAIVIVAVAMACLRPGSRVDVISKEQAVEIATALVMQDDPSFRPEKYKAKVYRECGLCPLVVDLYSDMGPYVAKRVRFTNKGGIEGPWTFESHQQVKSSKDGLGMYVLDRTGRSLAWRRT
jgi:hypothetical protein